MGLGNSTGRLTYVNINKGRIAVKVGEEIKFFGELTGNLTDLNIGEDEFPKNSGTKFKVLLLIINDGQETFQLKMRLESGYTRAFCSIIENADLSKPITFSPTYKEENGKPKTGMFLNQNGKALKWYYTKADPKGLPQLVKVVFKGKDQWDNEKQQEYFNDLLLHKIKPALNHALFAGGASDLNKGAAGAAAGRRPVDANDITEPIDDLPF